MYSTNYSAGCRDKTAKEHRAATKANKARDLETQRQGKEMLNKVVFVENIKKSKRANSTDSTN
jgi:hypothetical protein